MKLIANDLTYQNLLAMPVEEQDELGKQLVKDEARVKSSRNDYRETAKGFGKLACAFEVRLEAGKKAKAFAPNKTLAEFIEGIIGQKAPTHVMTLKNTFGGYVLTGFIAETDYNVNSNNCLEIAGRILTAVNGDLTHEAVGKAAAQLKERGDKEASNLRAILASVKPVKKLTVEQCLELFEDICAAGHVTACLAQLPDETMKMVETEQKNTYISVAQTIARLDVKLGDRADAWATEAGDAFKAPDVKILDAGIPREETETVLDTVPSELPETELAEA